MYGNRLIHGQGRMAILLQEVGIEGILNFTPVKVKSNNELTVNNINIEHELANLIYFVNQYKNEIKTS